MHTHRHETSDLTDKKLCWAVVINVLLTFAQLLGGVLSGSLALIADALHNFSDAASLGIALFARRVARRPADAIKTFGYQRAEIIAALVNLITLILIGLYLIYEAVWRFIEPEPIAGWIVVIVAAIALLIDIATALLTYASVHRSQNMRAAFIHNLSDALASVGVILAGSAIILFDWLWIDPLLTLLIAGYILWQGFALMPATLHILMEGAPPGVKVEEIIRAMEQASGVVNVHHLHVWQLDEHRNALEAHVVVATDNLKATEEIKGALKWLLSSKFNIGHSTLEFEHPDSGHCDRYEKGDAPVCEGQE